MIEVSLSHSDIPYSVGRLFMSDQPYAETLYLRSRNTQEREGERLMPPAGFEPAIATSERQHAHVSDRAATENPA
jgi:hypothetical protein